MCFARSVTLHSCGSLCPSAKARLHGPSVAIRGLRQGPWERFLIRFPPHKPPSLPALTWLIDLEVLPRSTSCRPVELKCGAAPGPCGGRVTNGDRWGCCRQLLGEMMCQGLSIPAGWYPFSPSGWGCRDHLRSGHRAQDLISTGLVVS